MNEDCLIMACDVAVRRALEVAGKRLLTRDMRSMPGIRSCPPWQVYVRLGRVVDDERREYAMGGAWACLPDEMLAVQPILDGYVNGLLLRGKLHTSDELRLTIRERMAAA